MTLQESARAIDDGEPMATKKATPKPPKPPNNTPSKSLADDLDALLAKVRSLRAEMNATFGRIGHEPQSRESVDVQIDIQREVVAMALDASENAEDRQYVARRLLDGCTNDIERLQLASDVTDRAFHRAFGEPIEVNGQYGQARPQGEMREANEVAQFAIVCGLTMVRKSKLSDLQASNLDHAYDATERLQETQEKAPKPFFVDLVLAVEAATPSFLIDGETGEVRDEHVGDEKHTRRQLERIATKYNSTAFVNRSVVSYLQRRVEGRLRTTRAISSSTIAADVYKLALGIFRKRRKSTPEVLDSWHESLPKLSDAALGVAIGDAVQHLVSRESKHIVKHERNYSSVVSEPTSKKPKK